MSERIDVSRLVRQDDCRRIVQVKRETLEGTRQLPRGVFLVGDFRRARNQISHPRPLQVVEENFLGIEEVADDLLKAAEVIHQLGSKLARHG